MTTIQMVGAGLFAVALVHTFSTKFFERMAHRRPDHAGVWHLLGEVEVVFGFWAMVLVVAMMATQGRETATAYLDSRNFTEPMFVFAIMVIAGSRAVLQMARDSVHTIARFVPLGGGMAFYFVALAFVPLLGSLITEPAAMTLAAMMLRDRIFSVGGVSQKLKYATLGVLFVNISIGGTLTPFAAPPVLMVAAKWNWDVWHMLAHFGWKAAIAVTVNALVTALVFRRELAELPRAQGDRAARLPAWVCALHLLFLAGVVAFAHHPPVFMGLFLFFMGFATAYPKFQDRLILREGLLVAFFLAGLVVLGGQQQWWLEPLLRGMDATTVYFGATVLTAVTDNAALTYLGSLVEGLSDEFKYALVAGAVTGGGLTVIANAPNPAGFAILRGHFEDEAIHPLGLLVAALPPTLTAVLAFQLL
ncbi:putative Na+/H+ antiporter [Rhizobacter sp. AJA081-3]|uniref:putative Na+/H+ antiporter n=1 Tax=Rhizobacter sp. AJA081-3 TaxID=2753607 RepID=UPI001ADF2B3F|nr:putative Na+/H+ antiporter [Rhizobacter sp. AJA081-3]QTN21747.1 putative Na+/H+ antiporter [Rhizobacter sp. AJA081-3]